MNLIDSHEFKHRQFDTPCPTLFIDSLAASGLKLCRLFAMQPTKGNLKT